MKRVSKGKLIITGDQYISGTAKGDNKALRVYDNNEVLISLYGQNKMGNYGYFVDLEGLCEHEAVSVYCDFCKETKRD